MREIVVAFVFAVVAGMFAPRVQSAEASSLAPPLPVVRAAALGRVFAAADLVWLKTVQLMGTSAYAAQLYPGLEAWIDLATTLDARFESPYFFGSVMLATVPDEERIEAVDQIMERGQDALPDSFALPMNRGFMAYFGRGDAKTAALHYREAARRPNAPKYLGAFANTLETQASTCTEMIERLKSLAQSASKAQAEAMFRERQHIIVNCVRNRIKRAETEARLGRGRARTTLDELVELGLLERRELEFHPPGECWVLNGAYVGLEPCPAPATVTP